MKLDQKKKKSLLMTTVHSGNHNSGGKNPALPWKILGESPGPSLASIQLSSQEAHTCDSSYCLCHLSLWSHLPSPKELQTTLSQTQNDFVKRSPEDREQKTIASDLHFGNIGTEWIWGVGMENWEQGEKLGKPRKESRRQVWSAGVEALGVEM